MDANLKTYVDYIEKENGVPEWKAVWDEQFDPFFVKYDPDMSGCIIIKDYNGIEIEIMPEGALALAELIESEAYKAIAQRN
jgi:hypothetical protein